MNSPPSTDARLPTVRVADRYGVVPRTIARWKDDPRVDFPKPALTLHGRDYWSLHDLEGWERARAAKTAAA